jgi:hypothetical protein
MSKSLPVRADSDTGLVADYALSGWELLVAFLALLGLIGLLAVILLSREARSRKMRFGIFIEREYENGEVERSEWPTQH